MPFSNPSYARGVTRIVDIPVERLIADAVMAECEALGVRATGLEVDLTDREATEAAVAEVVETMGRLDIA